MSTPLHTQNELMERRANIFEQAQDLLKRAEKEDRDLHSDEQEQYDRMKEEMASLKQRADRQHELSSVEAQLEEVTRDAPQMELEVASTSTTAATEEYKEAFNRYLRTGDKYEIQSMQTGVNADGAHFADCERSFRPIVNTHSGERERSGATLVSG